MEKLSLLERIKSAYILNDIFSYIMNDNFKFKLFFHSKFYQKKLGLQLYEYQERFINQFNMELSTYLNFGNNSNESFDKNLLKKRLENDITINKLDAKKIESCIINYFNNLVNEIKKNNSISDEELIIDIYSPFFEAISKTELFELKFTIPINADLIAKNNLKEDYISFFENLNASNVKYSSIIFEFISADDINYLAEFKIDFNRIKRIRILMDDRCEYDTDFNKFFKTLFSFDNICNNLVYLNIKDNQWNSFDLIELDSIKYLNNCKLLEKLSLNNFHFTEPFILELKNLKKLTLNLCENISFKEDSFLSLEYLYIDNCKIAKPQSLIKITKLQQLLLFGLEDIEAKLIFDFLSAKKLKHLETESEIFINFESNLLENVFISGEVKEILEEKKILEKLISLNNLQKFEIELNKINNEEILEINGENYSVSKAEIFWNNENNDCILYNLQNKFKNLSYLSLNQNKLDDSEISLEISENKNCKIKKLKLDINIGFTKLYCQSFENLIKIKIRTENKIKDLKNVFPIFNDDCKIIFNSLKTFHFIYKDDISLDIMKNIHKNLNKMPKLKKLELDFIIKDLKEDYYKSFARSILLLRLYDVFINIKKDNQEKDSRKKEKYYPLEELKEICSDIDYSYAYRKIYIKKYINYLGKNDKALIKENNNKEEDYKEEEK